MKNVRFSQMSQEERQRFNEKLIGILKKIMEICENNNISWFVSYGGCIGAVRHKGCIPWDDDIDVCMPRPDYDRFLKICEDIDLGEYELATYYNNPNHYVHFSRLYDKNSTILFDKRRDELGGILVDIFPLDGAADGKIEKNFKRFKFWQTIKYYSNSRFSKSELFMFLKKGHYWGFLVVFLTSLFRNSLKKISMMEIQKIMLKYSFEDSDYCVFYDTTYYLRNIIQKKWIEETIFVPFENIQVRIPKYYHEYLTHIYGDYMTPPPLNKRDDRHEFPFFDMEKRWDLEDIHKELSIG